MKVEQFSDLIQKTDAQYISLWSFNNIDMRSNKEKKRAKERHTPLLIDEEDVEDFPSNILPV